HRGMRIATRPRGPPSRPRLLEYRPRGCVEAARDHRLMAEAPADFVAVGYFGTRAMPRPEEPGPRTVISTFCICALRLDPRNVEIVDRGPVLRTPRQSHGG